MDNEKKTLRRFINRDKIADIAQAKRTAEKFGYKVELNKDEESVSQIKRPFKYKYKSDNAPAADDAKPNDTTQNDNDLAAALRTATNAGYSVRKMSDFEMAKDTAERHGYNVIKKVKPAEELAAQAATPEAAPADTQPAEVPPAEKPDPYLARAQYFMYDEDR